MQLETETKETRRLILDFTTHHRVVAMVTPGAGGVARAIEDAQRYLRGCVNIDPDSIRYRMEGDSTNGCTPDVGY